MAQENTVLEFRGESPQHVFQRHAVVLERRDFLSGRAPEDVIKRCMGEQQRQTDACVSGVRGNWIRKMAEMDSPCPESRGEEINWYRFRRQSVVPFGRQLTEAEGGYFPMQDFQLNVFEGQDHPEQVGTFRIVREATGAFDGKVYPTTDAGFAYVMGWLSGYRAMQEATLQRT